jgi:hypothetical protein
MIGGRTRSVEAPPHPTGPAIAPRVPDRRPAKAPIEPPDDAADFAIRFLRATHDAARSYRTRLAEQLQLRRLDVMARMRDHRLGADDAWAATAQRQIKAERQRRKVEIEADLRRTLREQNQQLERRVKDVEAVLAAYRAELDAYFDAIEREQDPVTIAERARRRPPFPVIDLQKD